MSEICKMAPMCNCTGECLKPKPRRFEYPDLLARNQSSESEPNMENTKALEVARDIVRWRSDDAIEVAEKIETAIHQEIDRVTGALRTQLADAQKQLADAMEALGAHIQADAYRETFPDNDADAEYLKKQETWWRLMARQWLKPQLSADAAHAAKIKVVNSLAFKHEIHAVTKRLNATRQPTESEPR